MPKFTDQIYINIKAGHGGAGAVSFRREKYIEKGGPDGGDGGKGGNVCFMGSRSHTNLSYLFADKVYKAENGKPGLSRNQHGGNGDDLVIKIPIGTEILDAETNMQIADIVDDETVVTVAEGGIGGKGNAFFKTSTMQTPRFSQPGEDGEEFSLVLNLKLIADVGLIGLPNAGKSTLLGALTAAKPKIGEYPFTTLIPNLGVICGEKDADIKIADIPGIIEGAHQGHGLGLSFLRHIERVKAIVFLIAIDSEDIFHTYELLCEELKSYNPALLDKPSIIVINKIDVINEDDDFISEIKDSFKNNFKKDLIFISAANSLNFDALIKKIYSMV